MPYPLKCRERDREREREREKERERFKQISVLISAVKAEVIKNRICSSVLQIINH